MQCLTVSLDIVSPYAWLAFELLPEILRALC